MQKKFLTLGFAIILVLMMVGPVAAHQSSAPLQEGVSQVEGQTIRIGTNAEYPPFEEIDADGNFVGFDIDLMNALAEDAGFEVEWINTRWDGIFFALAEGEFDAVISAATITAARERIVDFSTPYFVASQSISVRVDMAADVATPEDLAGLRVGVQTGTTGDEYATGIEGVEVVRFDEATLAFQALGQGDVDATIVDTPASAAIIANNPDLNVTIVGEPLTEEFYGIAVRSDFPELLDALNTSITNVFADGTYATIYEAHFGAEPPEYLLTGDYELEIVTVDVTDPASVANYALYSLLTVGDLAEFQAVTCEAYLASDDTPSEEDLAELEGVSFDISGLTYEATIDGDAASVTASGTITVSDGVDTFEVAFTDIFDDDTTELVADGSGGWLFCPDVTEE